MSSGLPCCQPFWECSSIVKEKQMDEWPQVDEKGVEFFLCSFVELTGAPKAKVVPASHFDEMATEGAGFAGFAAGDIGQLPHHPDMFAIPDFRTTTVLPWRPN